MALCCWSSHLIAQCTPPYLFPTLTATDVTCNGANDGCLTATPIGARGNVGYQWSTGATTGPTLCGLGQGFYTVTITDTLPNGSAGVDTVYFQGFEGTHGWNLAVSTGASGATPNVWVVGDAEGGVLPPGCGVANNGDNTLHITCTSLLCGSVIRGAVYNATQMSNVRAESPTFSTVGLTNLTLTFDYISNGDSLLDNASLLYNAGAGWVVLDPSLKSTVCPTGQGRWTAYSVTLPTVCENNPTVQLAINWTNNGDNIGTDPSVAINNILVSTPRAGGVGQVCTAVVSDSVRQPFVFVTSFDSIGPVVCTGSANGLVDLSVSGGTGPYTYRWSNGATTQDLAGLTDTTYMVTVTDANNCTVVDTAVVPLVGALALVLDSIQAVACFGDSTGAIDVTINGDTSGLSCSSPIVALNEIMYRPTLRNGQNPNTGEYIELIGPPGTNIGCYVLTDGDWTITIPPGTTIPSDGYFTIGNDIVWGAGTFDLDAENCNCFTEGTGGQGLLILTDGGEYVALFNATGTFLQGLIYGTPSVGNTPRGQIMNTVGTTGCVTSVTVPSATSFETAIGGLAANTSLIRDPDGSGSWGPQVGGSVDACNAPSSVGSGSNVTYLWSTGDTTQDISGLAAGSYQVTVTNRFGCTDTATYVVTQPASPIGVTVSGIDTICAGVATGSIDLTVSGGTAPYTFIWSNGATTEDLTNLPAGPYCGTITDANGCTFSLCDTIVADSLVIPVDTLFICMGDSIQLPLNTTLSTVIWSPSAGLSDTMALQPFARPTQTTTYRVRATGRTSHCVLNDSVVVLVDDAAISLTTMTAPLCYGDSTGNITTSTTSSNLQYRWNTGDTTTNLTNVGAGTYTLVATGALGVCTDTLTVTLNQPDSLLLSLGTPTTVTCRGGSDGRIGVSTVTGGTPGYAYLWSNTSTTTSLSNLTAGTYTLTVTDTNSCTVVGSVVVTQPLDSISITFNATPVSCDSTSDGTLTAIPINGNPAYTYQWGAGTGNQTGPTATNLQTGTYTITVTDSLGCTAIAIGLFVPQNVGIDSNSLTLVTTDSLLDCDLLPTGAAQVNTTNTYTYLWSNGNTAQMVNDLPAGGYTVTVSNSGCSIVLSGNIDAPFIPVVNPFIDRAGGTNFTTTGGVAVTLGAGNDERPRVQYNWTSTPTINIDDPTIPLTTGNAQEPMTYTILLTATADNGCQDTGTVYLTIESEFLGMPNAFTPNGDNTNDLYRPIGLTAGNIVRFRIFNRWGQEVYNGDNLSNAGWDGRFQGVEQPTEVYIYLLEYQISTNSRVEMRKGEFTLIR